MAYRKDQKDLLQTAMQLYGDAVYRLALSQMNSPADAEDVYQDVFLRLFKQNIHFEDVEHLKAWLLRVTINRCRDLYRSGWKRKNAGIDPNELEIEEPAAFDRELWEAVAALPCYLREVVYLHYAEGYRTDEIADIVHCKPGTVRSRLARARERLRITLDGTEADEDYEKEVPYVARRKDGKIRSDDGFPPRTEPSAGRRDAASREAWI